MTKSSSPPPSTVPSPVAPTVSAQTPLIAAVTYLTFSTSLTLANKYVFSDDDFNFPWTTLAIQSLAVVACLSSFQLARNAITFSPALLRQLFVPCLLFALYLFTNARALRHLSLPIFSVLKSIAPIGIAIIEHFTFRDFISRPVAAAMVLVIFANVVTLLNCPESPINGYIWAILNVFVNIAHVLSMRVCLSSEFTPVEKTLHANLLATVFMLPVAVTSREVRPFFQFLFKARWTFRAVFTLSCFLASAIGASIFWLVQQTSGSTLSFVGACNKFPVVVLGAALFHIDISRIGWISIGFGVLSGITFAIAKANEKNNCLVPCLFHFRRNYMKVPSSTLPCQHPK